MTRVPCAVVGSGNIGTDLMYKLMRSDVLEPLALVGIDPDSEGLKRARDVGLTATHEGLAWVLAHSDDLNIVFEATTAAAHVANAPRYLDAGLIAIDLTPAGVGPSVVPTVNLHDHMESMNVNMITCGGQATVPIVAAVSSVSAVPYAEIVSSVASLSAGPGTRMNIDEFTYTTSRSLETVGGAGVGKAIMILNPANPPIVMRNTVFCALAGDIDRERVSSSIMEMIGAVQKFVPGYRLKSDLVFDDGPFDTPGGPAHSRVVVLLEVEGAADYLPSHAGNLDIMTASATEVGESIAGQFRRTG